MTTAPKKLTLEDVARATGVSRSTVSNAFSRPDQLSPKLREEIVTKARALGYYGPDMVARSMRRRELREVAVVFHHNLSYAMSDASSIEFLRGVSRELDARQLTLQLIPDMGKKRMFEAAFQTTADAMVIHAEVDASFVPEIRATGKPVALVDSTVPGMVSVRIDDRGGAKLAMAHALASSPSRVIVLSFHIPEAQRTRLLHNTNARRSGYVCSERTIGYGVALREAGYPSEQVSWLNVDDKEPEPSTLARLTEARASLTPGTRLAIVAMSDRFALTAKALCTGWPEVQVTAVVGFDDIAAAAAAGLTTIRQDHFLKGQLSVRAALDGVPPSILPTSLVVRTT